ncbi:MAG: hypothetical protein AB7O98_17085 [Hyphomonadaceae bacterium]
MLNLTTEQVQLITLVGSVLLAFISFVFTYLRSRWLKRLDIQYEFVTAQLRDLYGPLYAVTKANSRTWNAFRAIFRPGRRLFSDASDPMTEDEIKVWAYWVTHVFQPSNRRMKQVIESHAHLFTGDGMPQCALDFMAHADMFELVVANWESGDFSRLFTPIPYPPDLDAYIEREYQRVSDRHAKLGGRRIGYSFRRPARLARA